jgi:hypothetical protein
LSQRGAVDPAKAIQETEWTGAIPAMFPSVVHPSHHGGGVTALCHDAGRGREMALALRSSVFFAHDFSEDTTFSGSMP